MDDTAVRMFALKLVVSSGSADTVADPFALADRYYEWLKGGQKDAEKPKGPAAPPEKTGRPTGRKR